MRQLLQVADYLAMRQNQPGPCLELQMLQHKQEVSLIHQLHQKRQVFLYHQLKLEEILCSQELLSHQALSLAKPRLLQELISFLAELHLLLEVYLAGLHLLLVDYLAGLHLQLEDYLVGLHQLPVDHLVNLLLKDHFLEILQASLATLKPISSKRTTLLPKIARQTTNPTLTSHQQ
jgi:hypothetical protein